VLRWLKHHLNLECFFFLKKSDDWLKNPGSYSQSAIRIMLRNIFKKDDKKGLMNISGCLFS